MGNLGTVSLVAHQKDLELLDIVHQELLETSWQHELGLLVATITDVGHQHLALEPPADPVVNTSGLTPVFRDLDISVRLMADELLGSLFDNLGFSEGPEGCHGD